MLIDDIIKYEAVNEVELLDKQIMLDILEKEPNSLSRDNLINHFTVSSYIVNSTFDKVLFCYHKIYDSYSWLGGHLDGNSDSRYVCLKEVYEESGIKDAKIILDGLVSLEVLNVNGHYKKNKYVNNHLHLNVTYLVVANEVDKLTINEEENSDLKWININDLENEVKEKWMYENIYKKINNKIEKLRACN